MEPIHVPAPAKGAFNKHRRMSDLIKAQIKHLKHIEHSLPQESRDTLPQHQIVTENDAALYIAPMTALLHSRSTAATTPTKPARSASQTTGKSPSKKTASSIARKSSSNARSGGVSPKRKK